LLLAVTVLASCAAPPEVRVTPGRVGPGEPVRVEVAVETGRGRHAGERELVIELFDALDNRLAERAVRTANGRAEAWLEPVPPVAERQLRLAVSDSHRGKRRRLRTVDIAFDAGRPVVRPRLLEGFHAAEADAFGRFRWTGGCLLAEAEDPGVRAVLYLRYRCDAGLPRTATVLVPGLEPVALDCDRPEPGIAAVPLPRHLWGSFPFLPIEIRIDPTFVPALDAGSADQRELGMQLYTMLITPEP
jgi:hypothetical protein